MIDAEMTLARAINTTLDELLATHQEMLLIGPDIGKRGGLFGITKGLQKIYGKRRVIDSPVSEAAMIGAAVGMAVNGLKPVCEIQFADFIHVALNQLLNEAAKLSYRSQGDWHVPMVVRLPYGGGLSGGLYHSQSAERLLCTPGLKVVVPSSPYDARGLLVAAVKDPNPVIFLEPRKGYQLIKGEVPEEMYELNIGDSSVSKEGSQLTIISYGMMHYYALKAANMLAEEGLDIEVVNLRTLYPLNPEVLLSSIRKTGRALIVYEDNLFGGYGAEISAIISEQAFDSLKKPVRRLAGPQVPAVPYAAAMQDWFMPDEKKISAAVRQMLED